MSAARVRTFIESYCVQTKGQWGGEPIKLMPWQNDILDQVYQTPRVIRDIGIWIPRRNGKSTFLAALALFHLFCDNEPGAEVYVISNTVSQSRNLFDQARYMVEQFPRKLRMEFKCTNSQKRIEHPASHSKLQVLSGDINSLPGTNSSLLIFDEIGWYKNRKLYTNLRSSQMNRKQPLSITISSATDNLDGIGYEQFQLAKAVRDGHLIRPSFLPVIYESPPELAWDDPTGFAMANPSLGYTICLEDLQALADEAKAEPRKRAEFEMNHLTRWKGNALGWIDQIAWNACGETFDPRILLGKECVIGVDTARCFDLTAVVLLFKLGELYYVLARYFMPQDLVAQKELTDFFSHSTYIKQGLITATPGEVTDYSFVRKQIQDDAKLYKIKEIAYDPAGSTELLCNQQLGVEDGFTVVPVKPIVSQIGSATKLFEKLILDKKLRHGNNPVLTWNSRNVSVVTDAYNNIRPCKKDGKDGPGKIDGISAAITALSRMTVDDNIYNRRGLIII